MPVGVLELSPKPQHSKSKKNGISETTQEISENKIVYSVLFVSCVMPMTPTDVLEGYQGYGTQRV